MCRVLLPNEERPFSDNRIVLLLSWFRTLFSIPTPCDWRNLCVWRILDIMSSTATNSASVDDLVFNFCFEDIAVMAPPLLEDFNRPPVCDLKSLCTPKVASTYQTGELKFLKSMTRCNNLVPFKYLINLLILSQSWIFGACTLPLSTEVVGSISGQLLLATNSAFITIVWKSSFSVVHNNPPPPFLKRSEAAGVFAVAVALNFSGQNSIIFVRHGPFLFLSQNPTSSQGNHAPYLGVPLLAWEVHRPCSPNLQTRH